MLKLWLAVWNCRRISCLCRAVAQQGLARTLLPAGIFCCLSRIIRKCSRQHSSSWSDLVCSKGPEFRDLWIHWSYIGWKDKVSKADDKQVNCWSISPWHWMSLAPLLALVAMLPAQGAFPVPVCGGQLRHWRFLQLPCSVLRSNIEENCLWRVFTIFDLLMAAVYNAPCIACCWVWGSLEGWCVLLLELPYLILFLSCFKADSWEDRERFWNISI